MRGSTRCSYENYLYKNKYLFLIQTNYFKDGQGVSEGRTALTAYHFSTMTAVMIYYTYSGRLYFSLFDDTCVII